MGIVAIRRHGEGRCGGAAAGDQALVEAGVAVVFEGVPRVVFEIEDHLSRSYVEAGRRVSEASDVVIVQHEFGIFGGSDGSHLLAFLAALNIPYVMTLHTVGHSSHPASEMSS